MKIKTAIARSIGFEKLPYTFLSIFPMQSPSGVIMGSHLQIAERDCAGLREAAWIGAKRRGAARGGERWRGSARHEAHQRSESRNHAC